MNSPLVDEVLAKLLEATDHGGIPFVEAERIMREALEKALWLPATKAPVSAVVQGWNNCLAAIESQRSRMCSPTCKECKAWAGFSTDPHGRSYCRNAESPKFGTLTVPAETCPAFISRHPTKVD